MNNNNKNTYADPWMLQRLGGSDALERVDRQHLVDEALGLRRDGVPFGRRVLWVCRQRRAIISIEITRPFRFGPTSDITNLKQYRKLVISIPSNVFVELFLSFLLVLFVPPLS